MARQNRDNDRAAILDRLADALLAAYSDGHREGRAAGGRAPKRRKHYEGGGGDGGGDGGGSGEGGSEGAGTGDGSSEGSASGAGGDGGTEGSMGGADASSGEEGSYGVDTGGFGYGVADAQAGPAESYGEGGKDAQSAMDAGYGVHSGFSSEEGPATSAYGADESSMEENSAPVAPQTNAPVQSPYGFDPNPSPMNMGKMGDPEAPNQGYGPFGFTGTFGFEGPDVGPMAESIGADSVEGAGSGTGKGGDAEGRGSSDTENTGNFGTEDAAQVGSGFGSVAGSGPGTGPGVGTGPDTGPDTGPGPGPEGGIGGPSAIRPGGFTPLPSPLTKGLGTWPLPPPTDTSGSGASSAQTASTGPFSAQPEPPPMRPENSQVDPRLFENSAVDPWRKWPYGYATGGAPSRRRSADGGRQALIEKLLAAYSTRRR